MNTAAVARDVVGHRADQGLLVGIPTNAPNDAQSI
jgi:hypothetical protein